MLYVKYGGPNKKGDISGDVGHVIGGNSMVPATCAIGVTSANVINSTEHLNGNAPVNPVDNHSAASGSEHGDFIDEEGHNTSTLLVGEKTNGKKNNLLLEPLIDLAYDDDSNSVVKPIDLPQVPWDIIKQPNTQVNISPQFQNDIDSIEKFDDVDATKMVYLDHKNMQCAYNGKQLPDPYNRTANGQYYNNRDDEEEKEETTVKCLYYAIQCCECTIS